MNIRALRLPILFTGFILSVLVSLSAFSMRSYAADIPYFISSHGDFPVTVGNITYNSITSSRDQVVYIGYSNYFSSPRMWCVVDSNSWDWRNDRISISYTQNGVTSSFTTDIYSYDTIDGNTAWFRLDIVPVNNAFYLFSDHTTFIRFIRSNTAYNVTPPPAYADFGFNNISYTTYLPPSASLLFEQYQFDALSYFFSWQGSTNPDFPITSFNYELYGFFDSGMSNTDKSNGELVDSGSHSVPDVFSYEPPYSSLLDIWGALKYDKVILYLTPFSNTTEGNTFYVVFNVVRGVGFEVNLGPLGSIDIGSSVRDVQFGDGVLPVPQTDALLIEDDKYMPVSYIDQVPVIYAIKTTSGSYNRHIDIYHENISYAPVVYGDTEYITNNDNSKVTNNNQSYNVIINNINGTLELDPDGSGYADSIVSFLSMIVVFFQTCWTYFFQGLLFFPDWVRNLISGLIGLLATIVAALAVLKIMRGIL